MKKGIRTFIRILSIILFVVLLPIILIELLIKLVVKLRKRRKWENSQLDAQKLLLESGITEIDLMEGYQFEFYLQTLLFYLGYKVEPTTKSRDWGADLILTDQEAHKRIVVQAKRYSKTVGARAVQEIVASKLHYEADDAWVISNNYFSEQAESLAKENNVRLIDRNELVEMYKKVQSQLEIESHDGNLKKVDLSEKYPFYI